MDGTRNSRRVSIEIAAVSFVVLFQELALIRWIPTQVRVVAYFPNVVLMSAFLGLGIGCLLAHRRLPSWTWPASTALLVAACIGMSRIAFTQESTSEHLWLLYLDLQNPPVVNDTRLPIIAVFVLCAFSFVSLGHFLAGRIAEMSAEGRTLTGYALDLLGSLAGAISFAMFSYLWTPPVAWFATFLAVGTWLFGRGSPKRVVLMALSGIALAASVFLTTRAETFSPYYAISTMKSDLVSTVMVLANGSLHQYPAPLMGPETPNLTRSDLLMREGYPIPYRALESPPERVLVLGAGTGNDVAVALASGAREVDAVEIDPAIIELGRTIHPDRPYSDPRVRVFNDDARSFLEKTDRRYDLIVFGTLDSMTRLSALSSVRLDNFVYTRECLEAAKNVMTDDAGVAMYFMVSASHIAERLTRLHLDVFGDLPAMHAGYHSMFNMLLLSGPAFDHVPRNRGSAEEIEAWKENVEPSTDDWPYLYLRSREFTPFYIQMIAMIVLVALVGIFGASREMRSMARAGKADWEMLALGGAFLLLETKSVTEMNLAWGATWLTSAIVFGSILLTLLAATLLMDRRPISARVSLTMLAATLLVSYASPVHALLDKEWPLKLALSVLVIGSPIFFASTLFAVRFKARTNTAVALGWNLLGAVLGGLLEFTSMVVGIRALALIALALYVASAISRRLAGHDVSNDEAEPVAPSPA